jgi:hydrogenase nickel incorporation protein HypA/HybF
VHELSVTKSLLEIAVRHAKEAGAERILGLNLVIGQLSSFLDESVQFYWDMIATGTIAEGAQLHFKRIPAEFLCRDCGIAFRMSPEDFICPVCKSNNLKIVCGDEFFLESMEVNAETEAISEPRSET